MFPYICLIVIFHAGVAGADLLRMQWFHNGVAVPGADRLALTLERVTLEHEGVYWLTASNHAGSVPSAPAALRVEVATVAEIVLQPWSETLYAGQSFNLSVLALGTAPLEYEWFKNGASVTGATNRHLTFTNVAEVDAGIYFVIIRNPFGSTTSLPATLEISTSPTGGAYVWNSPHTLFQSDVWVFDADGVTMLYGLEFVAQLYAGRSPENLRAVGIPRQFAEDDPGVWYPELLVLSFIAPGERFYAEVRVWDSRQGTGYEEARAMGGKFGRSAILTKTGASTGFHPDAVLGGLQSFTLQAGLPEFNSGRIRLVERQPGGNFVWELEGSAGFRYLIEKRFPPSRWDPYVVLTNETGVVRFSANAGDGPTALFFRSRILD